MISLDVRQYLINIVVTTAITSLVVANNFETVEAAVLTFDDIPQSETLVPNGYGRLNWYNMRVLQPPLEPYFPTGYDNGVVSAPNIAHSIWAVISSRPVDFGRVEVQTSGEFVKSGKFDFKSAYLTAAWNDSLNINVYAYSPDKGDYFKSVIVDSRYPTKFDFNFIGIEYLSFSANGGTNAGYGGGGEIFVLDNFTYQIYDVPEPITTLGLLAFGTSSLIFSRKDNKNQG